MTLIRVDFIAKQMTDLEFVKFAEEIISTEQWERIPYMEIYTDLELSPKEHWQQRAYAFCKDHIPEDKRWRIFLDMYLVDGYRIPKNWLLEVLPYRPYGYLDCFPAELKSKDEITVYRASTLPPEDIDYVDLEISWTINPKIAERFYKVRNLTRPCYYYKAQIYKANIIAYIPFEYEVLQLCDVFNVQHITEEEIKKECEVLK